MAGLVLATWSLEGAEGKFIKLLQKSIKLTIQIAISHSGIAPLLRSFLRLRRPAETCGDFCGSRWGDPAATASPLSLKELQLSRRLATPHWSALEEVSAG